VAILADRTVTQNEAQNKTKTQQFMYRDTTNVEHEMYDCTVVIGAIRIVTEGLKTNFEAIAVKHLTESLKQTAVLGTSHVIRTVLQSET
jgi:hypothetical protein